jgi:hypothetical protein
VVVVLDWPGRSHCFGFGVGDSAAAAAGAVVAVVAVVAAAAAVVVVGSLKGPYPDWIDIDYPLPTAVGLHTPSWDQGDLPPIEDPLSEPEEYASLMYPFIPYFVAIRVGGVVSPGMRHFARGLVGGGGGGGVLVEDRTDRSPKQ